MFCQKTQKTVYLGVLRVMAFNFLERILSPSLLHSFISVKFSHEGYCWSMLCLMLLVCVEG